MYGVVTVLAIAFILGQSIYFSYRWLAWNGLTKEFEAVCVEHPILTGAPDKKYRVVEGPYTQEFWELLRFSFESDSDEYFSRWGTWQEDGSLIVPVGFDFIPKWYNSLGSVADGARERDWSIALSERVASIIFKRLRKQGADITSYRRIGYNSCGFLEELITVGGAFAGK